MTSSILSKVSDSERRFRLITALVKHNIHNDRDVLDLVKEKPESELTHFLKAFLDVSFLDASALSTALTRKGTIIVCSSSHLISYSL